MIPDQFLLFADSVAQNPSSGPAGYRSAIFRAYYAVYLQARDLIGVTMGFRIDGGGNEHKFIQRLLLNCSLEEGQEVGELLKNLHQSRREADYDMDLLHCESQAEARLCVARAQEVSQRLATCASGMVFTKIKLGIRAYLQKTNSL